VGVSTAFSVLTCLHTGWLGAPLVKELKDWATGRLVYSPSRLG
jgi:hypothetical protein